MKFRRETEIQAAYHAIDAVFRDTPQFVSADLSRHLGSTITLKIETVNPIGCFKGRGTDYLFFRRADEFRAGVAAASAGNFGQGLAYSARKFDAVCTIFAPLKANPLKIEKMKALGAEVILHGNDFDEAKTAARRWANAHRLAFVEDGQEPEVAIGAGTIAYELLKEGATYDALIVPLGNGSLLNGMAKVSKALSPTTKVIGVCAQGAPAMAESFRRKSFFETESAQTIADGIAVRTPVKAALKDLFEYVDDVVLVSDDEIKVAMRSLAQAHRLLIEPAGAVGLAALSSNAERFRKQRVAIPLCGANVTDSQIRDWLV